MADVIQLLPDSIANQIAAGEVVQRPASVVKELLENSIDARATMVTVIVKDSGKSSIQVIDDGTGMSVADARMCFERHATSKIRTSDDLFSIHTMGFRGEALASIAAVAQVDLKTRREEEEMGTQITVEGSMFKKQDPAATGKGTSILVKNLFYIVPARRNFLKSGPVEMKHILDEFQRVAIGTPEISYQLYHNDLEVYNLPAGKLSKRIVNIFGKSYQEQLVACDEKTDQLLISGYIGKPEFARKTRGEQFLYVNGRFIRNNYLNHAVITAYEGLLPPGSYPFYTLFIELDPRQVDVNVHPTKTEVKFIDERTIYSILRSAVKQALGTHHVVPALDFNTDVNFSLKSEFEGGPAGKSIRELDYERLRSRELGNIKNWESLFDNSRSNTGGTDQNIPDVQTTSVGNIVTVVPGQDNQRPDTADPRTFQVHNRFIITQVKSGMIIVDQVAAFQRIWYEKYLKTINEKSGFSQRLLFPVTVELNPNEFSLVMEIKKEINSLGFEIEAFGTNAIIISGIPSGIGNFNEKDIFEGLFEQFKSNRDKLQLNVSENLARSLARYAALKFERKLHEDERKSVIDQLFGCSNPNYTAAGEPTFVLITLEQIDGLIKKKK